MAEPHPGLVDRGKRLLELLLQMGQTRLELLSVEIQREKQALARQLLLGVAMATAAWLAGFALILWIALAMPPPVRFWVLGSLFGVLLAVTIGCAIALRRGTRREALFLRLIAQLRLDRAALSRRSAEK